jgi:RNA polymerase sigma-70 factor (ECF subfamily)
VRRATTVVAMQRKLVERAIEGDREAFSQLVSASVSRQYAVATLILRDRDRAQDAVQEAMISAWKGLSALRNPDAWEAWLHRLTVRACFAQVRKEKRRRLFEIHVELDREPAAAHDDTVAVVERDRLERALDRLPIDQRAVIVLHYHLGLPLTEAAPILDIPVGTAKSRLHRGLKTLRLAMSAEPEAQRIPAAERVS